MEHTRSLLHFGNYTTSTLIGIRNIYTIILFKSAGVSKLQVAILARSSREMSQTVRIDWKHILSRVCVSVRPRNFFIREKHPKLSRIPSHPCQCLVYLKETPTCHCSPVTVDQSPVYNVGAYMSSDNSDHIGPSGVRLSQNGDNDRFYLHGLKNVV